MRAGSEGTAGLWAPARWRLASGLVLMAFAVSHLANHALGVVSLDAMERGREAFELVWRGPVGATALYGAFAVHIAFTLQKQYRRRTLRMPAWEAAQVVLGLVIPFLLVGHVAGTGLGDRLYGVDASYPRVLRDLWPDAAVRQLLLVLLVWLHGCLGLHYRMRLEGWYPTARPWLFAAALLLPTLAAVGFANGGREATARPPAAAPAPPAEAEAATERLEDWLLGGFAAALGLAVLGRAARPLLAARNRRPRLIYPNGAAVVLAAGMSVLEASRSAGVAHASVCGGRGRCSTCRVRVGRGADRLPPPDATERRVLARIAAPPDVRLACRLRPVADVAVTPLVPPGTGPSAGRPTHPDQGVEHEVAVLFVDLRGFTRLAENRLPFDVVFLLNQYFAAVGRAVEDAGGRVDKFIGDGVMALFGAEEPPEDGARRALAAVRGVSVALEELNGRLGDELRRPLRVAMGLHQGPSILGSMGYGAATGLTAIGDAVNVASRLEAVAKTADVELCVSAAVIERAGLDPAAFASSEIAVRGRRRPLAVHLVADAKRLPEPSSPADARPVSNGTRGVRHFLALLASGRR